MRRVILKESQAPYVVTMDDEELGNEPLVLERNGRPVAVVIPFAEYTALRHQLDALPMPMEDGEPDSLIRDRAAFKALKEQLLVSHPGQYVAFKDGQLVDADSDDRTLIGRLYRQYGVVPLYVKRVELQERIYHLPSPRVVD
ncbi:MAG: hypothetical protein AB1791_23500 [Chloroflexota bacterium]